MRHTEETRPHSRRGGDGFVFSGPGGYAHSENILTPPAGPKQGGDEIQRLEQTESTRSKATRGSRLRYMDEAVLGGHRQSGAARERLGRES
jgi:hypothetical protein